VQTPWEGLVRRVSADAVGGLREESECRRRGERLVRRVYLKHSGSFALTGKHGEGECRCRKSGWGGGRFCLECSAWEEGEEQRVGRDHHLFLSLPLVCVSHPPS